MTESAAAKQASKVASATDIVIAEAFKRVKEAPEAIFQAAVRLDGKIYGCPQPDRHHHVQKAMKKHGLEPIRGEQGFVTTKGRFVDRKEGLQIAIATSQIVNTKTDPQDQLFSEDMW